MKYIAKTFYGLENVLAEELKTLGASEVTGLNRAASFNGDKGMLYKANFCLRTALSVLMIISEFRIRKARDIYKNGLKIEWDHFMDPEMTFSVVPVINSNLFSHSGYAGLVLKDAIADWFRNKSGRRPSVDSKDPGIVFNLHISNDQVTISVDSSGIPLYKRGYRKEQGTAPINEVLAAGIISFSGWNKTSLLLDPMCGSGTIPIEAAIYASGIPPGRYRRFFGFQRWKDYDKDLFERIRMESEAGIVTRGTNILGSDISENAITQATVNITSAGLSKLISVSRVDFRELEPPENNGIIIMNPPYGRRIKARDIELLYGMIGTALKHHFTGFEATIITSDREALKQVGLKPSEKRILFNGSLECLLVKYKMYPGSKKK